MNINEYIRQIEKQQKEQNAIFHTAAVKYGLSDTAMWILYFLSDFPDGCTQQNLCGQSFFAKQTINTATGKLIRNGFVELTPIPGTRNQKRVRLTGAGTELAKHTTDDLRQAEQKAYGRLTEEELRLFLDITTRITLYLREETEK